MADQVEMDALRAELRALSRRLTDQQMLELAELMLELAGVPDEPRSWRPRGDRLRRSGGDLGS